MHDRILRACRFLPVLCLLLVTACARSVPIAPPVAPAPPSGRGEVKDLRVLPQDLNAYLQSNTADRLLMTPEQRSMRMEELRRTWLLPWTQGRPTYNRRQVDAIFHRYEKSPAYGRHGERYSPGSAAALASLADLRGYPNMLRKAVTVTNTNQRGMPTATPRFANPNLPGEGYPFDYLQHTSLPPGTPLLITHVSRDGAWYLTESALTFGWVPAADVAFVDEGVTGPFFSGRLGALIKEHVVLPEVGVTAGVGTILPLAGQAGGRLTLLAPVREASGAARLVPVHPAPGTAAVMPMPLTPRNVAAVGNQFMGQPYGWGGLDGKRDCSAVTHDLFVPFGIYLPRNSGSQAAAGGAIPLGDMGNAQKESTILSQGVPFATLIWMKGHIMVYVGQWQGHPLIFHAPWGLHTFGNGGRDGRLVIGRVVVTTLRPGEEVPAVGPQHLLLNRVRAMTILAHP